jgi:hypothetical protein
MSWQSFLNPSRIGPAPEKYLGKIPEFIYNFLRCPFSRRRPGKRPAQLGLTPANLNG